ncbi:MAG: Maf family protein [Actinomycetales bacterium]|nr:Maf family protein [Actinomycetales bacterium]
MGARIQHAQGVGAPEPIPGVVGHARDDPLAGDRVRDEDDPPRVPGHPDAAVSDLANLDLDLAPRHLAHPPRIGAALRLVLASTSPARLATLRAVGIEPVPVAPGVDEEAAVSAEERRRGRPLEAAELVMHLARLKSEAVAGVDGAPGRIAGIPDAPRDALVLGGDSAFAFDGTVYGKPHLPDVAARRWRAQRGRSGVLHSGHWLVELRDGIPVAAAGEHVAAEVRFAADLDDDEIDAYVATGEPLEVAGAFTIDSKGAGFIESIVGDPHTVVGVSIPSLRRLVRRLGHAWPALWNR